MANLPEHHFNNPGSSMLENIQIPLLYGVEKHPKQEIMWFYPGFLKRQGLEAKFYMSFTWRDGSLTGCDRVKLEGEAGTVTGKPIAPTAWGHYGTLRRQVSCTSELPDLLTEGKVSNQVPSMPSVIDSLWNGKSLHIRHAHGSEKLSLRSSAQLWVFTYLRFTEQQTKVSCTEAGSPRVQCKS